MGLHTPPKLNGEVHVAATADKLYDDLAMALLGAASDAVGQRDAFHLALSGGKTPEPFYIRLVTDPRFRALPWDRTHLWIVDERRVPETDDRSNYKMISESLADHVPMRRRQRHPMPVMLDDPAGAYEQELREVFGLAGAGAAAGSGTPPRLDFVLLGMGDDGHTASLFPHSPALGVRDRWVTVNEGPTVTPPARVTMTYPLLNAARNVAVLVVGGAKAATLRRVGEAGAERSDELPISGIDPEGEAGGFVVWYLDSEAAGA